MYVIQTLVLQTVTLRTLDTIFIFCPCRRKPLLHLALAATFVKIYFNLSQCAMDIHKYLLIQCVQLHMYVIQTLVLHYARYTQFLYSAHVEESPCFIWLWPQLAADSCHLHVSRLLGSN